MADLERLPDLRSVVGLVQTIAYQEFDFILAYVMAYSALCSCFSKLAWQALASTPGAACDLLGEAAAPQAGSRQPNATHKLASSVMLQAQAYVYDKNVLAVLRIYIFGRRRHC